MDSPFDQLKNRGCAFAVFVRAILDELYETEPGESLPLRELQENALDRVQSLGRPIAVRTVSVYTSKITQMGVWRKIRQGRHYDLELTDLGADTYESLMEFNQQWGTTLDPGTNEATLTDDMIEEIWWPHRKGKRVSFGDVNSPIEERRLFKALWAKYKQGEMDIVFVPRDAKCRVIRKKDGS